MDDIFLQWYETNQEALDDTDNMKEMVRRRFGLTNLLISRPRREQKPGTRVWGYSLYAVKHTK